MTTTKLDDMEILLPVSEAGLDLLEWFGQWTPDTHKANWDAARAWGPGWRSMVSDLKYKDKETVADYFKRMLVPQLPLGLMANVSAAGRTLRKLKDPYATAIQLTSYGLLEGDQTLYRLTPKGRAALKVAERTVPDFFRSHCPEIFDEVTLLPRVCRGGDLFDLGALGDDLPDMDSTWYKMLRLYPGGRVHGTQRRASFQVSPVTGRNIYLQGSLRAHSRALRLTFESNTGHTILEAMLSSEQLMEAMTSQTSTYVTLDRYVGYDGMPRSEPCPPPIPIGKRMEHRMHDSNRTAFARIAELRASLEGAKMGKKAKKDVLDQLDILENNWPKDTAFAVTQAVEEVSSLMEQAVTIAQEKQAGALADPDGFAVRLLGSGEGQ